VFYKPAHKSQSLKTKYFTVLRYGTNHSFQLYIEGETLNTYVIVEENAIYDATTVYYKENAGAYEALGETDARS
jgi:hypothetical protein